MKRIRFISLVVTLLVLLHIISVNAFATEASAQAVHEADILESFNENIYSGVCPDVELFSFKIFGA